jgi:hypothetical protein
MSYAQRNFDWRVFVNEAANETAIFEHTQGGKTRGVVPPKSMGWWDCGSQRSHKSLVRLQLGGSFSIVADCGGLRTKGSVAKHLLNNTGQLRSALALISKKIRH